MYMEFFEDTFQVACANNQQDFIEYFQDNEPDIALIDVNINDSEKTGIDLVNDLMERKPNLKTKFVALTAYQVSEINLPSFFKGSHSKPVRLERLIEQIENILNDR